MRKTISPPVSATDASAQSDASIARIREGRSRPAPRRSELRLRRAPALIRARCQAGSASSLRPRRQGSVRRSGRAARATRVVLSCACRQYPLCPLHRHPDRSAERWVGRVAGLPGLAKLPRTSPREALPLRAALEAERVEALVVRPRRVAVELVDPGAPENDVCRVGRAAQEERPPALSVVASSNSASAASSRSTASRYSACSSASSGWTRWRRCRPARGLQVRVLPPLFLELLARRLQLAVPTDADGLRGARCRSARGGRR
jgi:hypothetical protein